MKFKYSSLKGVCILVYHSGWSSASSLIYNKERFAYKNSYSNLTNPTLISGFDSKNDYFTYNFWSITLVVYVWIKTFGLYPISLSSCLISNIISTT